MRKESKEKIVYGYKATDENIQCQGYQFVPGQWHTVKGKVVLCENGFHFCKTIPGVKNYYDSPLSRVWRVAAIGVISSNEAGTIGKFVAKKIKLIKEVKSTKLDSNFNLGHHNSGQKNYGDYNSGSSNIGCTNSGNGNTGNFNSGACNFGNDNVGYRNEGDSNVGHRNKGSFNCGDFNIGDSNSGSRNVGNYNTGFMNIGSGNSGFFCNGDQKVFCFDGPTNLSIEAFNNKYEHELSHMRTFAAKGTMPEWGNVRDLPNITKAKLRKLISEYKKLNHI
jgi:hypothetical protein